MIVWGGSSNKCAPIALCADGAAYSPGSDAWTPLAIMGAPVGRSGHAVAWTGDRMIVWGGRVDTVNHDDSTSTGGIYDPVADTWSDTPTIGAPQSREMHTAVWTGQEMIVWGGQSAPGGVFQVLGDGGHLDPASGQWKPVSLTNAPTARAYHVTVWTGQRMLVWGGASASSVAMSDGGAYDPVTDAWSPLATARAPSARYAATAVWTGTEMAVWGGLGCSDGSCGDGALYDPVADRWRSMGQAGAPQGRKGHTAVWTGTAMIVWGGAANSQLGMGGVYDSDTGHWNATGGPPGFYPRANHTAVWTGTAMLIWGGLTGDPGLNLGDGASYTP